MESDIVETLFGEFVRRYRRVTRSARSLATTPLTTAVRLAHLDFLDQAIEHVSGEITERVRPVEAAIAHLDTIPGWVDAPPSS